MEKINLKKVKIDKDIVKWVNWLNDVNTSIYTNRRLKSILYNLKKNLLKKKITQKIHCYLKYIITQILLGP